MAGSEDYVAIAGDEIWPVRGGIGRFGEMLGLDTHGSEDGISPLRGMEYGRFGGWNMVGSEDGCAWFRGWNMPGSGDGMPGSEDGICPVRFSVETPCSLPWMERENRMRGVKSPVRRMAYGRFGRCRFGGWNMAGSEDGSTRIL